MAPVLVGVATQSAKLPQVDYKEELARMRDDFAQPGYHQARRRFLYGSAAAEVRSNALL